MGHVNTKKSIALNKHCTYPPFTSTGNFAVPLKKRLKVVGGRGEDSGQVAILVDKFCGPLKVVLNEGVLLDQATTPAM